MHITNIDHHEYPLKLRTKTHAELLYIIKDASEAIAAMPDGHKAGYYADEISYAGMEIMRRRKQG
jgi:hypothetical protein